MSDRYSYIARIIYDNDDEYDEYFGSEEEATEWAESLDTIGVAGFQILRIDWHYHCETVINDFYYC